MLREIKQLNNRKTLHIHGLEDSIKLAILSTLIYGFNANHIKSLQMIFFVEIDKLISNFICKSKGSRITFEKLGGFTLPI